MLTLLAASLMLIDSRHRRSTEEAADDAASDAAPARGGIGASNTAAVRDSGIAVAVKTTPAAALVGFLTGLLGVGGGFLIVPALVSALRMPMLLAVGTSLLIIAVNSAASLAARTGGAVFEWSVIVPFTAAAIIGSLAGKKVADRLSGTTLTRAFAVVLIAVAGLVAVQSGLAAT